MTFTVPSIRNKEFLAQEFFRIFRALLKFIHTVQVTVAVTKR